MAKPIEHDDVIEPVRSNSHFYTLRSRDVHGVGSSRIVKAVAKSPTKEADDDEEANTPDDRDFKPRQVFTGVKLLWLAYQSTGVIYGDIGTSPLYVYSSTFTADPSHEDILGVLSLIIWSLTIMVSIKYVCIVLRADDEGEGGTFALFSLLSRYANIVRRDPREELITRIERQADGDLTRTAKYTRNLMERSKIMQWALKVVGLLGVALVMSDGILTPAQSVLGAIQGIQVVDQDLSNGAIVGASCAVLVVLFLIQPFGTTKLASGFAPIVILWLLFNAAFGIYNLVQHDHSVLRAFSPYFAGAYLVRNGTDGWRNLGGVLLAFTGCEALFADLGAFTRRAVQLSWLLFAFPCLLLAYIGQAAFISDDRTAWTNPFFNSVPPGMFWPSLILAIFAAIVASQAMVTAVFQLLTQVMKLSYFPQLKIVHTSSIFYGQVYIPLANWMLMIGSVIVTAAYSNTTRLGHAYGFCVILVSFITTCMVALVALVIWQVPAVLVAIVWLIFACFEGTFLSASITKVADGAWFTLVLAAILSTVFVLWRFGKEQQWRAEASDRFPPSFLMRPITVPDTANPNSRRLRLTSAFGGHEISRIGGIGIFFDKAGAPSTTPTVFIHFLQKFHAANDVIIFFNLRPLHIPTVPPAERYQVTRCYLGDEDGNSRAPMPNCYRITIRHGYNDEIITDNLGLLLYEQLRTFLIREPVPELPSYSEGTSEKEISLEAHTALGIGSIRIPSPEQLDLAERLAELQMDYNNQVVYVVGKEQMRIKAGHGFMKKILLELFLWIRENARTKVQTLNVSVDKLVEVGFVKEV